MKLLMFSIDLNAFESDSDFQNRLIDYGRLFEEIYVIVFIPPRVSAGRVTQLGYNIFDISGNVHIVPAVSAYKFFSLVRAYRIASRIVKKDREMFAVTTQEEFTGIIGWLLKVFYHIPWQAQVHSDIFSPYFRRSSFKNKMRVLAAKFTFRRATCIRVVSERIKTSIEKLKITQASIVVLPIFVDASLFGAIAERREYEENHFDFVVVMSSRFAPEKDIFSALRAFRQLIERYPQTTLRIVGDGFLKNRLEKYANELKLGAHVQFEGWKNDVRGYLQIADCFLMTSQYEGYGMSVVEAMATGLPVVMTDVGVAGGLLQNEKSGLVVSVGDDKALAEALGRIRGDAELRKRLGEAARQATESMPTHIEYLEQFQKSITTCNR